MIQHKVVGHNNEAAARLSSKRGYDSFNFGMIERGFHASGMSEEEITSSGRTDDETGQQRQG
jgi:hypothetical protein